MHIARPNHTFKSIHPHILKGDWKENHQKVNSAFL